MKQEKMNFAQISRTVFLMSLIILACFAAVQAQTTAFTYQGRFTDSTVVQPTSGTYNMQFALFDSANTQIGATITNATVQVTNGVFTVSLDFGANSFDGTARFLEVRVFSTTANDYVVLNPRQPITSTPYAIRALKAATADNALNVGGTPAANIIIEGDARLTDTRTPTAGSANYVQNTTTEQTSTDFNIGGGGTANIFNARTQFNIGGVRVLTANGSSISAGVGSGNAVSDKANTFFGEVAGSVTTGGSNSFFGNSAGRGNTTGSDNSFFGSIAGLFTTTGKRNTFVGGGAGYRNQTGNDNTFVGVEAGTISSPGNFNTFIGSVSGADVSNLQYATAIGAGATVSNSNSVVLGRALDTVRIPGTLNVSTFTADTLSANTVNADTQFNIGGNRVFSAPGFNTFVGLLTGGGGIVNSFFGAEVGRLTTGSLNSFFGGGAGFSNLSGSENSFFGRSAGFANTSGSFNSFFGVNTGADTTTGNDNSFFGWQAGVSNSTGIGNAFFGRNAGSGSTTGNSNVFVGLNTGLLNITGSLNTLIGSRANVGSTNLTNATALGAGAVVNDSNSVVLGRTADTVRIPGSLNIVGTFSAAALSANTVNADTQFNLGGNRVLSVSGIGTLAVGFSAGTAGTANAFFGTQAGNLNTGSENAFFGSLAGFSNLTGGENAFFGRVAGGDNTTGRGNSFFGSRAGRRNTIGGNNAFFGTFAGDANISGNNNTIIGDNADVGSDALIFATAIGAGAVVSDSNTIMLGRTADTVIAPNLLQVNVLGAAGDISLCRNAANQISTCTAGNLAEKELVEQNTATTNALREQKAQIERQQRQIDELKQIVCSVKPDAVVCQ